MPKSNLFFAKCANYKTFFGEIRKNIFKVAPSLSKITKKEAV